MPSFPPDDRPTLLILTGDLFLGSRLQGAAERAGYRASVRREPAPEAVAAADRVLVDLSAIPDLSAVPGATPARTAAYAPHVRVDLLKAARSAGLAAVFTRGQLDAELPRWLRGDVFTEDVIDTWVWSKTTNEVEAIRQRPHPYEFALYYDI